MSGRKAVPSRSVVICITTVAAIRQAGIRQAGIRQAGIRRFLVAVSGGGIGDIEMLDVKALALHRAKDILDLPSLGFHRLASVTWLPPLGFRRLA